MSNLTSEFSQLLAKRKAAPLRQHAFHVDNLNSFLKEAYRINHHIQTLHMELKDVRQAYLSTAQPRQTRLRRPTSAHDEHSVSGSRSPRFLSDRDREEIDANAKNMIRELNASIRALDEAENLRRDTDAAVRRKRLPTLGLLSWAAGNSSAQGKVAQSDADSGTAEAKAQSLAIHRDGVLWLLRHRLEMCCSTQQSMMEVRLVREMEKNKSLLLHESTGAPPSAIPGWKAPTTTRQSNATTRQNNEDDNASSDYENHNEKTGADLTAEQIQMFEQDNQEMLEQFESALTKVHVAEKSLMEIAELQSMLVGNLTTQSAHIEQLVSDSHLTTENLGRGNKELTKASERPRAARLTFFATTGLCAFLVLWDLVF